MNDSGLAQRISLDLIRHRLKIRQLVVFNAVFDECSLRKAAIKLCVTQPSVTRTIRELESLFDCKLFDRYNRGVGPTVFGHALSRQAKLILSGLRHTVDEFNRLRHGEAGHVIVGTLISASAQLLPFTIAALKQHSPSMVVTVSEGTNDLLLPALANGEIDIVLGRIPDETDYFGIDHHVLYHEPLYALVSRRHPLSGAHQRLSLADLLAYQWVIPVSQSPLRRQVQQRFEQAGLSLPERIVESVSIATNLGLLNALDAIGLVPGSVARYYAESGDYCILEGLDLGYFGAVGYSVSRRSLMPAAALFIECLQEQAGKINSSPTGAADTTEESVIT